MIDKVEKDYYKVKYAQLLSIADNDQVMQHLDNVNKRGELVFLVSGVINFWMENSADIRNAQNADIALRKLATILGHLESEVIESILENINDHTIKDQLTEFLIQDIDRLVNIYHARPGDDTALKFCFLMNFIDHENLLRILAQISSSEIKSILDNEKNKKLFSRALSHILSQADMYQDVFLDNNYLITLLANVHKSGVQGNADLRKEDRDLMQESDVSMSVLGSDRKIQTYSILQLVNNFGSMDESLKMLFTEKIVPAFKRSALGKVIKEVLEQRVEVSAQDLKLKNKDNKLVDKLFADINKDFKEFLNKESISQKKTEARDLLSSFENHVLDGIKEKLSTYKTSDKISITTPDTIKKMDVEVGVKTTRDQGKIR